MTPAERAKLEKEIIGLTARLRWDHISQSLKNVWEERIREIRVRLATERPSD